MRVALLLLALSMPACSGDDSAEPEMGGEDRMELPAGRYQSDGGRGKTAAVEIFPDEGGLSGAFFAELHDFCFAQRCVQGLVACGSYHLDGLRLHFEVDEYRRADGAPETSPHRMSAAYEVHPQADGSLRMIEIGDDDLPIAGAEQRLHFVGAATHDMSAACAIAL